jgi:methyl-accepting chemotaxis protein
MAKTISQFRYIIRSSVPAAIGASILGVITLSGTEIPAQMYWLRVAFLFVSGGLLGTVISTLNYRRFVTPMKSIMQHIDTFAQGNFSIRLNENQVGELKPIAISINNMSDSLQNMMEQLREMAFQVATSSEQLSTGVVRTEKATKQIADAMKEIRISSDTQIQSLQESTHALTEMAQGIQQVATHAHDVSSSAIQASDLALEGAEAIQSSIQQMRNIQAIVADMAKRIQGLDRHSQEIGHILEVISEISAQTNLLALNAAIEAARAGEHGRGFAVVADEVRKLAEQSGQSAKQITELIQTVQSETRQAVHSMETGSKEVMECLNSVNAAGKSFEMILSAVKKVAGQIQEVSAATQQISAGTDQVVNFSRFTQEQQEQGIQKINAVSDATQEQLAFIEQIVSTAGSMSQMAEQLQKLVLTFHVSSKT